MSFSKLATEDQRYVILRVLSEDNDYSLNEAVLRRSLELYGHSISQDALRTQLAWLEEQELLSLKTVGEDFRVATLTTRGLDVAQKRTRVPGVARPLPGL